MKPFLSVLIPTYNRAQMTLECVKSVGNNPEVEIVVVDDCTPEDEYLHLAILSEQYTNAVLYRNSENIGMTKNFNRCMELAKGEWFGLIGSDDLYKPGAIDRAVEQLHKLEPCLMVYSRSNKARLLPPGIETIRNLRLPSGSGNFWHRSIYEDLGGFDERLQFSPDAEYWYRIAVKYPVCEVPERYSVYREHGNNLMYDTWRKRDEFIKQIRLITRLNMVHKGMDVTDLDLVVGYEGQSVWDTVVYIMSVTCTKPDKFDIFDMYAEVSTLMAHTSERKAIVNKFIERRSHE